MAIPRRLRFEVLRRDGYACRYCGQRAPDVALTVDHVIPVVLGGGDDPRNLVTACGQCNAGKTSIAPDQPLVDDVDAAAMLFARAIAHISAQRRAHRVHIYALIERFDKAWTSGEIQPSRPPNWPDTIERFYELGLDADDLRHYLGVAWRSRAVDGNVWRYFCGCCWREIATRQEGARQLIEDGDI